MGETILDRRDKIKSALRRVLVDRDLFSALLMLLIGVISFGLGRLSVQSHGEVQAVTPHILENGMSASVEQADVQAPAPAETRETTVGTSSPKIHTATSTPKVATTSEKKYVASKNGTKYHLPWCSGAARIAEKNKIWFSSKEEAAAAGYAPASNCKGI